MKSYKFILLIFLLLLLIPMQIVKGFGLYSTSLPESLQSKQIRIGNVPISINGLHEDLLSGQNNLRLISESPDSVIFEVLTPWEEVEIDSLVFDNKTYSRVNLPGWLTTSEAGAPGLPFLNVQIGAPFGAELKLHVSPGKEQRIVLSAPVTPVETQSIEWHLPDEHNNDRVLPIPKYRVDQNPLIYSSSRLYPSSLAEIGNDGILRQQRIIGINSYPFQYNPITQELIFYETLLVEVNFVGGAAAENDSLKEDSDIYDNLLSQNLLNYETSRLWRLNDFSAVNGQFEGISIEEDRTDWSPPDPGWRIKVQEDGFYKLTYAELYGAGLPDDPKDNVLDLDPRSFQIFNKGNEIAIFVVGEEDGAFNYETDYILFYGQGIESKYTSDNIYWLTYGKVSQGLRMTERDGTPGGADVPSSYLENKHVEENIWYMSSAPGDDDLERWLGQYIYTSSSTPVSLTYSVNIDNLVNTESATLSISILGNLNIPDHHVKVYINDQYLGEATWSGINWQNLNLPITSGTLIEGNNIIKVECPNDTAGGVDYIMVDDFDLGFGSSFTANNGELAFTYSNPGAWLFEVDGFSTGDIEIFDITAPSNPVIVSNFSLIPPEGAEIDYAIQFQDVVDLSSSFRAVENLSYQIVPLSHIEQDLPSNLQEESNGADHITITHSVFKTQADILSGYRSSPELRTEVVDVQDIYDEFNFGIIHPSAIRDFLAYTYENWQAPKPSYVVLLGDGHYDPKDYKGYGQISFIPPFLSNVDLFMGETAADNLYVTLAGDDNYPDMMLGRLAVRTTSEASAIINKIIDYEQNPPAGNWKYGVLAVADDMDDGGDYAFYSENLLNTLLPDSYEAERVYYLLNYFDETSAQSAVLSSINSGKIFVNYIGHGSPTQWGGYGSVLFKASSVASLTNGEMLPIMLPMTCSDGYFINPSSSGQSVSEVITRIDGKGAVASWSPTGYGTVSGHDYLNRGFLDAYFYQGANTLGEATQTGKFSLWSTGSDLDLLDTYLLFGDPATKMVRPVTAGDDSYSVNEDETLIISHPGVLENDLDDEGDQLSSILVSEPTNGNLTLNTDGSFTYIPDNNFFGTDTFTYVANDGSIDSNLATVRIAVNPVPDSPVAEDDTYHSDQNETLTITPPGVLSNDSDPDGDVLTASLLSGTSHGILNLNTDGSFVFTPDSGYAGSDSFSYIANDGTTDSNTATVTIQIGNFPPVAVDDFYNVNEDTTLSVPKPGVLNNDSDPDGDPISAVLVSEPLHGSVTLYSNGSFAYIPELNFTGIDSFNYTTNDGVTDGNIATATITVNPLPDAPIATNDTYDVDVDTTLSVTAPGVLSNDNDPDGDPLSAVLVSDTSHGTLLLNADGSFSYTPDGGFLGNDSFSYIANDGQSDSNPAVVTIMVYEPANSEISIPLLPGWNLVSINLIPDSPAITDLLSSIEGSYDLVYAWDAYATDDQWLIFDPLADPYANDLTDLNHRMGFWINMSVEDTLVITGTQPGVTEMQMKTGWNLVGYPSTITQALPGVMENNGVADFEMVIAYHAGDSEPWKIYDPLAPSYVNDLFEIVPGFGYWVDIESDSTWTITYDQP